MDIGRDVGLVDLCDLTLWLLGDNPEELASDLHINGLICKVGGVSCIYVTVVVAVTYPPLPTLRMTNRR